MKIKKVIILIFVNISVVAFADEDFLNSSRDLRSFSPQYDFGTPLKKTKPKQNEAKPIIAQEKNATIQDEQKTSPLNQLKKELNLKCGGKCGIDFKNTPPK